VITNPDAHAKLVARVGKPPGNEQHWLLARIGHSATPPRSYRVPERAIFIDEV
jgi:hypothetical protein